MEEDRAEALQRSIDALMAKIEEQKQAIGSLLRDSGPRVVCAVRTPALAPWPIFGRRPPETMRLM